VPRGKDFPLQADVSQEDQVREMFRKVIESFGSLDVLINKAGIQIPAPSHAKPK
jgi:glucose 1-dehydrogenase